jgi:hypothetical protein
MLDDETRRRFLLLTAAGATTGLAGCGGTDGGDGGDGGDGSDGSDGGDTPTPEPVPQEYRTATAQDGTERNPDGVSTKSAVKYQSEPKDGQQCSGCRFYIPDKNGDGVGACAIVEGKIDPSAWCASYTAYQTDTDSS